MAFGVLCSARWSEPGNRCNHEVQTPTAKRSYHGSEGRGRTAGTGIGVLAFKRVTRKSQTGGSSQRRRRMCAEADPRGAEGRGLAVPERAKKITRNSGNCVMHVRLYGSKKPTAEGGLELAGKQEEGGRQRPAAEKYSCECRSWDHHLLRQSRGSVAPRSADLQATDFIRCVD